MIKGKIVIKFHRLVSHLQMEFCTTKDDNVRRKERATINEKIYHFARLASIAICQL